MAGRKGHRRPWVAPNKGRGKELPRNEDPGALIPEQPGNRRERRASASWSRQRENSRPEIDVGEAPNLAEKLSRRQGLLGSVDWATAAGLLSDRAGGGEAG